MGTKTTYLVYKYRKFHGNKNRLYGGKNIKYKQNLMFLNYLYGSAVKYRVITLTLLACTTQLIIFYKTSYVKNFF